MTMPLRLREYAYRTLPVRQCRFTSAGFADASRFPTTFGTLHAGRAIANVRAMEGAAL